MMRTVVTPLTPAESFALRAKARLLCSIADCDERTAARALRDGPQVIRSTNVRERIVAAMQGLAAQVAPPE